jgi:hypothetical protein
MAFTVSTLAREPMIPAIPHMAEVYASRRWGAHRADRPHRAVTGCAASDG